MNDDEDLSDTAERELHDRVKALRQEHADLDASIEALEAMPVPDQLRIARIKRRKLALRDEIVKIERILLPDIIA